MSARRPVLAVIGAGGVLAPAIEQAAEALGRAAIEAGFRLVTGGRDGVMEASSRGDAILRARSVQEAIDQAKAIVGAG